MSFNTFLIQLVGISCGWSLLRAKQMPRGWVGVSGAILLILLGLWWLVPEQAGWISSALWLLFVVIPLLSITQVTHLVRQERYRSAQALMTWIRWLHPFDSLWQYPHLLQALDLAQQGEMQTATQTFKRYQNNHSFLGRTATAWLYRTTAQWPEARFWIEHLLPPRLIDQDATIAILHLRSLGELGELDLMLQQLQHLERTLTKAGAATSLQTARLMAFAFCGQVEQVRRLLPSTGYPVFYHQFWLATAEAATGQTELAHRMLVDLQRSAHHTQQQELNWRFSHPLVVAKTRLAPDSHHILQELETALTQENRYSLQTAIRQYRAPVTWGVIALNVGVFAVEMAMGGSNDSYVLYRLGAMVPQAVVSGEGWRLLTALFLHSGITHLLANMLALYLFGSFVERAIGRWLFFLTYFTCGVGSMGLLALHDILTHAPNQLCVGASGAIMGLLGVMGIILWRGWRREKAAIAREHLVLVGAILGLQVISDLLTPQVSLLAHLLGLLIGCVLGSWLPGRQESMQSS